MTCRIYIALQYMLMTWGYTFTSWVAVVSFAESLSVNQPPSEVSSLLSLGESLAFGGVPTLQKLITQQAPETVTCSNKVKALSASRFASRPFRLTPSASL